MVKDAIAFPPVTSMSRVGALGVKGMVTSSAAVGTRGGNQLAARFQSFSKNISPPTQSIGIENIDVEKKKKMLKRNIRR
jgi:hypothetical protein